MIFDKKTLILAKKLIFLVSLTFLINQILPHKIVFAKEVDYDFGRGPVEVFLTNHSDNLVDVNDEIKNYNLTATQPSTVLPENENQPYYETWITSTAYTSRPEETDDSPYTAAWGDHVFWGMVASNSFAKGTKIQIPDYFGDKMFSVLDTMNRRYYHRVDIWMPDLQDARAWGAKYIRIRVFK